MQTTRLCTLAEFFNHHHVFALHAAIAQFSDGSVGVGHQALFVGRIGPRTCHHACAVSGPILRRDASVSTHRGPPDPPGPFQRGEIRAISRATRGPKEPLGARVRGHVSSLS